jgi:hypothetical protein
MGVPPVAGPTAATTAGNQGLCGVWLRSCARPALRGTVWAVGRRNRIMCRTYNESLGRSLTWINRPSPSWVATTGMPPDILSRVFETFSTSKEQGKGTELVVRQLGGAGPRAGGAGRCGGNDDYRTRSASG